MTPAEGAHVPEDLWEGMTDDSGFPLDDVYGDDIAPHISEVTAGETVQEKIAARYRLPEEFWGARELFKAIRQAAWANQAHPDAVLACVLARAAGAIGHEVKFDSGRGPSGTLSLFVCLLAKSGIGKSEAAKAAEIVVRLPRHLLDMDGTTNMDVFRDGVGIGTGEGIAEAFMGIVERDTGRTKTVGRSRTPEPVTEKVKAVVRHRAYFFADEGSVLNSLMNERKGSILGATLRTAWSGGTLGQSNAREETTRFVKGGQYAIGVAIGYQPETAVELLQDVGPGTPQRFLWFGAQDTEMPETRTAWPEPVDLIPDGMDGGVIEFPDEIKEWFFQQTRAKHLGTVEINPMDSHEPLMRAKLTALLCYLDGRMMVDRDDWVLAGMIWSVSKAIRDRLVEHRDRNAAETERVAREKRLEEATEIEVMRVTVTSDVERVARYIVRRVSEADATFESVKRYQLRKNIGRDKQFFDAALTYARSLGWIKPDDEGGCLVLGPSRPRD
jgi:hypothetical protein